MDAELAQALRVAREKVKDERISDFRLILDVAELNFVWVSEEAARTSGRTVSELIGSDYFQPTDIPLEELRALIMGIAKNGGKFTLPISGSKDVMLEFTSLYVTKERPFLIGSVTAGT